MTQPSRTVRFAVLAFGILVFGSLFGQQPAETRASSRHQR